ncbi:hypothetical protein EGW08_009005 [Elysia chlorotica]|uniref:Uncharacterized protein n=1 Tax=Elysia chlorotica TaxID=188477 RepID=A0A3S1BL13_ELYCH|nr:hypothetical protein EGW08_009005 [Elysia chlorotica]
MIPGLPGLPPIVSSRPLELGPPPPPVSMLASMGRSLPEGIVHPSSSFLTSSAQLGLSHFPRPSPYHPPSLLSHPLGFSGLGSSVFAPVRDSMPPPAPQDWGRLHRPPTSTFPSWPKSEADREREKERERDIRREEERDRERRASGNFRLPGSDDHRHKTDPSDSSSRPKSRSRSRSPMRNGRIDPPHGAKLEPNPFDRRYEDKRSIIVSGRSSSNSPLTSSGSKIKEERREGDLLSLQLDREKMERERLERDRLERDRMERDRLEKEKIIQSAAAVAERAEREKLLLAEQQQHRDKLLHSAAAGYHLGLSPFAAAAAAAAQQHQHSASLIEQHRRMTAALMGGPHGPDSVASSLSSSAGGSAYPFLDPHAPHHRAPPSSLWSPFLDKAGPGAGALELAAQHHRLEFEREARLAMMARHQPPHHALLTPHHLALEQEHRLKEQLMLRDQQHLELEALRRQQQQQHHHHHLEPRLAFPPPPPSPSQAFTADRLRAVDPLAYGGLGRTISPMFGPGSAGLLGGLGKSGSPHHHGPLPPPLIPSSATAIAGRNHDNSPSSSSGKLGKGCSPADSTTDLKDKGRSSSTDPDTHSR